MINAKIFMSLDILLGIPVVIMAEPLDETSVSIIKRLSITFILVFPPLVAKLAKAEFDLVDNVQGFRRGILSRHSWSAVSPLLPTG